jgi:hypothetical protein
MEVKQMKYENLEMEVIKFEAADVITASGQADPDDGELG